MTPMKAIRAKCIDCCCGSSHEVKLCPAEDCPLWPYRFGHRPKSFSSDLMGFYGGDSDTNSYSAEIDPSTVFSD